MVSGSDFPMKSQPPLIPVIQQDPTGFPIDFGREDHPGPEHWTALVNWAPSGTQTCMVQTRTYKHYGYMMNICMYIYI